jgi:very-short-patch-repair endonuclease
VSEATAAGLLRIKGALLDARRELIDLSRRNRLLNASRTGPRPHCLEIVNADPDAVFTGLMRAGKPFGFAALADSAEFSLEPCGAAPGGRAESSSRSRLDRLQTRLPAPALERRLVKFFREARTFEEEQGINILFLALGFLHWFEDDRAQERCSAPLLLVPVMLERRQGRDGFVLRGRDDDVNINISLAEKLRGFGIALPDLPEGEDWLPSAYMNAVANAVAPPSAIENRAGTPLGQRRWEVERDGIGLGFFTFSKFLMWRQLDPGAWPDERLLVEHDLVARLLGEGPPGEPEPPLVAGDEPIDRHIDLAGAVHVLDADSSQALCIREVLNGHNLVIQGPPGTGKSQTIANLIAGAAHDGKSVLFVAEKAAALDVVHGRLKTAGLEPLCLEIHSRKAAKLSVVAALERALEAGAAAPGDGRTEAELRAARDRLNGWSAAIHREIRHSGRTPYQVIGTVLKLRAAGTRTPDQRLDGAADWDRDRLMEAERAVAQAAAAVEWLRCAPRDHPWYGTQSDRLTPFDLDRLREAVAKAREELGALMSAVGSEAAALLDIQEDLSGAVLHDYVSALRLLARAPGRGRAALSHPAWRGERPRIGALVEHGKLYAASRAELADPIAEAAWAADVSSVRRVIAAHGRSWLRCFNGAYRDAVAELRALCRAPPPRRFEARLKLLDSIIAAQSARRGLEQEEEFGRAVLGSLWTAADTDWAAVEALLDWAEEAARSVLPAVLFALAPTIDPACCAVLAAKLESALGTFSAGFARLAAIIRPDLRRVFGSEEIDQVSLAAVADKLDGWMRTVEGFNDWVMAREALALLRQWGITAIAEGLEAGTVRPGEASPMAELLIAEALWRAGCGDDPVLDRIDGELRSETVLRFRALDRERIALARLEVLARYCAQRPNGQAGEMGIVRAEIGKKRRHLPIRRLMEVAGPAIQRLKPIFLMSPLSVAQYLPPGRLSFDLVVIDEASQVPPEEAIGVIARGRQVVVVGDDKQLPPTNFFRMVAGEDEAEEAADAMPAARPRDFESILTLARARGHAERMLRWHYRSRHPSLIALSNQTCYGDGLLLPPSPCPNGEDLGLSLVRTPRGHYQRGGSGRNPAEAELIAEAIERHLTTHPERSLGVACFSVAQRDAIEDALQARGLSAAVEGFAPKGERLFVKNLEAVQGDERDTILISIGYGPDAEGRMTAGFGPLSAEGGERRLNVLISRARLQCVVFSSITAGDIPADAGPRGTRMLREFLHFAETGHIAAGHVEPAGFDSPFEEAVALVIRRAGYAVVPQVGVSGFRIDLGVLCPQEPGRFILGVECDGAAYHSGRSARDRDRLRQEVLEGLGWTLYRIWSTDWFRRPAREKERLLAVIERAAAARSPPTTTKMPPPEAVIPAAVPSQKSDAGSARSAPYRECALSVPQGAPLLALDRAGLAELASAVVREEGPIHAEEVARRIREAFGLERTGRRILAAVRAALHSAGEGGSLVQDGEFWSHKERELTCSRSRREAAPPLRRADRIAPSEYRLAIRAVLDQCIGAAKPELVVEVAHLLGFDRIGNGLDRAISEQIDAMIAAGELTESADSVRIAAMNNETMRQ